MGRRLKDSDKPGDLPDKNKYKKTFGGKA